MSTFITNEGFTVEHRWHIRRWFHRIKRYQLSRRYAFSK